MRSTRDIQRALVEAGRRLYARGLIAATEGNLSARTGRDFLTTPRGVCKGDLTAGMLVRVNADGKRVRGRGEPSSELFMHLALYRARPEVGAVVHAHPPVASGFAAAHRGLDERLLAEAVVILGPVCLVPYAVPGTEALARALEAAAPDHDAFLLENHGAVTVGRDVWEAFYRMETLERLAQVCLVARTLGGEAPLAAAEAERLRAFRAVLRVDESRPASRPRGRP